jgi:hypothetical protein
MFHAVRHLIPKDASSARRSVTRTVNMWRRCQCCSGHRPPSWKTAPDTAKPLLNGDLDVVSHELYVPLLGTGLQALMEINGPLRINSSSPRAIPWQHEAARQKCRQARLRMPKQSSLQRNRRSARAARSRNGRYDLPISLIGSDLKMTEAKCRTRVVFDAYEICSSLRQR